MTTQEHKKPIPSDTSCKDCCFSIWENGTTQIGCKYNLLTKYHERGSIPVECYDEELEFYVIPGRLCPKKRSRAWAENNSGDIDGAINRELMLSHVIVITLNGDLEAMKRTLDSISLQVDSGLKSIYVVNTFSNALQPSNITDILKTYNIQWKLENLLNNNMSEDTIVHNAVRSSGASKGQFVTVLQAGDILSANLYSDIRNFVIEELQQFGIITLNESHISYVMPHSVFEYWYFNTPLQVEDSGKVRNIVYHIEEWQRQNPGRQVCHTRDQIK